MTPVGTFDLRDVTVTAYDQTRVERFIPTWAIVLAVTGFSSRSSVPLLLVRDTRVSGHVVVQFSTVGGLSHAEHVLVSSQHERDDQFGRVSLLQTLIGAARARG